MPVALQKSLHRALVVLMGQAAFALALAGLFTLFGCQSASLVPTLELQGRLHLQRAQGRQSRDGQLRAVLLFRERPAAAPLPSPLDPFGDSDFFYQACMQDSLCLAELQLSHATVGVGP